MPTLSPAPLVLLTLQQATQIDPTDGVLGLLKTLMECDLTADLLDQLGGDVEGLQFSLGQNGQQDLDVHMLGLTRGTTTIGFSAFAAALDERTGKHFAQAAQTAD